MTRITAVTVETFRFRSRVVRDAHGHGHPGEEHDATQSLLIIAADGCEGHYLGSIDRRVVEHLVAPVLVGQDPFYRERLWQDLKERQRLHLGQLPDRALTAVDLAL